MFKKIWDYAKKDGTFYNEHPVIHAILFGVLLAAPIWIFKFWVG